MPETPMNKNYNLILFYNDIWFSNYISYIFPVSVPVAIQIFSHYNFRTSILALYF